DLTTQLGRQPSTDELAAAMKVEPTVVRKLVEDVHRATVLNYESLVVEGSAEGMMAADHASPEEEMVARERRAYLTDAVSALPERLRLVVIGYFFEDRSMQDI